MNRSPRFVSINAQVIAALKNFKIEDLETLQKWTYTMGKSSGLLSAELLMSEKQNVTVT